MAESEKGGGKPDLPFDSGETQRRSGGSVSDTLVPARAGGSTGPAPGGEVLAGRYRILRFLAQGGMGAVYEAEDLELGGRVALKTIRPDFAGDAWANDRFRREIQLARKVTHPNVCRIFDLGHHEGVPGGVAGPSGKLDFLTMELLEGETLSARLARGGRMTAEQALPLVAQLAAGLAAAHRAGVVHRDFKSENVILVAQSGAPEPRAVITDFGLARATEGAVSVSVAGGFVGSPGYMAPEQVEGGNVTAATDVYALGVVLFEMVTGALPFAGDTPFGVAMKRLKEPPPHPRKLVPGLDPAWEAAILTCLARRPEERFQTAGEVLRALTGDAPPWESGPWRVPSGRFAPPRRRRWALVAGALAVVLAGAAAGVGLARRLVRGPAAAQAGGARRAVAVLGLRNLSGKPEAAWLATALSETLASDLASGGVLRVVPGETLASVKADLKIGDEPRPAAETVRTLHDVTGADVVVSGSYLALGAAGGGQVRVDVTAQSAAGDTLATVTETGTENGLIELAGRLGAALRAKLGVAAADAADLRRALPSSSDAAQLYAEGIARLHALDHRAARDLLERAAAADPSHALTRAALAEAYLGLGELAHAAAAAREAAALAADLPRDQKLRVEAIEDEASERPAKAAEIYRALFTFYPDDVELGLRLLQLQIEASAFSDAEATLAALRALPAPARDDVRIDLKEAGLAEQHGQYARSLASAGAAIAKAERANSPVVKGRAVLLRAIAEWRLGKLAAALADSREARRLCGEAGHRTCVGDALDNEGSVDEDLGELAEGRARLGEALALFRDLGQRSGAATVLINLGNLEDRAGERPAARKAYEEALAIHRERGARHAVAAVLMDLGNVVQAEGDLAGSLGYYQQAIAAAHEVGNAPIEAGAELNVGDILYLRGDLAGARARYESAGGRMRALGVPSGEAYALNAQGVVAWQMGQQAPAREAFAAAQKLEEKVGDKRSVALTKAARSALELDAGDAAQAEALAREGFEELQREQALDDGAQAGAALARALLARGKAADAKQVVEAARQMTAKSVSQPVRFDVGVADAEVRAATGANAAARKMLGELGADAERRGFLPYAFEARLADGAAALGAGRAAEAQAALGALQRDANQRGFARIARRAEALRAGRN